MHPRVSGLSRSKPDRGTCAHTLPEHQEPLLVSVLLGHLRHGRETTTVLEDCLRELRLRLKLAPLAQVRINSLVTQYIRIVGG